MLTILGSKMLLLTTNYTMRCCELLKNAEITHHCLEIFVGKEHTYKFVWQEGEKSLVSQIYLSHELDVKELSNNVRYIF